MTKGQPCQADLSPETSGSRPVAHSSAVSNLGRSPDSSQVKTKPEPVYQVIIGDEVLELKASASTDSYEMIGEDLVKALMAAGLSKHLALIYWLFKHYRTSKSPETKGALIVDPVKQETLAELFGVTRKTISGWLAELEEAGIITPHKAYRYETLGGITYARPIGTAYAVNYRMARRDEPKVKQALASMTAASTATPENATQVEASGQLSDLIEIEGKGSQVLPSGDTAISAKAATSTAAWSISGAEVTKLLSTGAQLLSKAAQNYPCVREGFKDLDKYSTTTTETASAAKIAQPFSDVVDVVEMIKPKQLSYLNGVMPSDHLKAVLSIYQVSDLSELTAQAASKLLSAYEGKRPEVLAEIERETARAANQVKPELIEALLRRIPEHYHPFALKRYGVSRFEDLGEIAVRELYKAFDGVYMFRYLLAEIKSEAEGKPICPNSFSYPRPSHCDCDFCQEGEESTSRAEMIEELKVKLDQAASAQRSPVARK